MILIENGKLKMKNFFLTANFANSANLKEGNNNLLCVTPCLLCGTLCDFFVTQRYAKKTQRTTEVEIQYPRVIAS